MRLGQGEDEGPRGGWPRVAPRGATLALFWVLGWGAIWLMTDGQRAASGFWVSFALGAAAVAPGFVLALVIFVVETAALLRGRDLTAKAVFTLTLAFCALLGGVIMNLTVFELFLARVDPTTFPHGCRPLLEESARSAA